MSWRSRAEETSNCMHQVIDAIDRESGRLPCHFKDKTNHALVLGLGYDMTVSPKAAHFDV